MSSIVIAGISPHPPLIIPGVGGREINEVRRTVDALTELSAEVAAAHPQTVIFITPHGPMHREAIAVLADEDLKGDFGNFRAPEVRLSAKNDLKLLQALMEESNKERFKLSLQKRKNLRCSDECSWI